MGDLVHGRLEGLAFGGAHHFLDRGIDERRSAFEQAGEFPGALHQLVCRQDLVDEAPAVGFRHVEPATGQEHVHGDVIGDALRKLDRGGVRNCAGADFR
ncbi:hypothetical protein D9M70_637570 [compost metagenome]